jgi:aminoglycoside phosphotransferase (APT) family kinase protein
MRVLHLDLHPDNVILTYRGPVLIDWRNATEGPPDLDVALSALILAQVAVDESDLSSIAEALLRAFMVQTEATPLQLLERAVAIRRADPNLTTKELNHLPLAAALVRMSWS